MAFTRANVEAAVSAIVQDDASFISAGELDIYVDTALEQVNKDRPNRLPTDISGDGTQDYALTSAFEKGFSDIVTVETPAGESPPRFRPRDDDWFIYEDPTKAAGSQLRLRFNESTPQTGETIRVVIRTPYVLTDLVTTLDPISFLAVKYKASELYFKALGARFAQTTDSTIAADAVDYGGRSQNYLFLAERFRNNYNSVIGLNEEVKAAQAMGELDIRFAHGEDMLFHPTRLR